MPVFHDSALIGAAGAAAAGGGNNDRSLRFNSADSAYLSRTPASAGNRKTWTWAGWVKRSGLSSFQRIFVAYQPSGVDTWLRFEDSNQLRLQFSDNGVNSGQLITTAVFRDPSAWLHIVAVADTTNSTSTERMRLYVNGSRITIFSSSANPSQNYDTGINATIGHYIGQNGIGFEYFSGYLADIHFIDGQALDPTSFGEFSAITGVWMPKAYTGTYGTNGWQLKFEDNSNNTATTLGKDTSGNGNNWTPNNLSVTAGAGNDSLVDVPTNGTASSGGDAGGATTGNYCTWNPLDNGGVTLSNGNLDGSATVAWKNVRGTIAFPGSGKWYFEVVPGGSALMGIGIAAANKNLTDQSTGTFVGYNEDGRFYKDGSINASGKATYTSGDVIGVAFDCDTNSVTFYKNNVSQGSVTPTTGVSYFPFVQISNASFVGNWGARSFAYTAPSGFKALCTANLPAPTIEKPSTVMDVVTYTGTGSTLTATSSLGFSPDLVWIKSRSAATDHTLYDVVRGAQARLESNNTDTEVTSDNGLTAFNSNGFTLGTLAQVNTNAATYAGWCFDCGSSTVTNNTGTITGAQVRANSSAGTSVVAYTGNNTAGATVGHGLGVAPGLIIIKRRGTADDWLVYHSALGATKHLLLNSTAAEATGSNRWNSTAPTSTVFSLGSHNSVNGNSNTYIAYCFAPVSSYSAFGSYTGNGSADGPFVYTGFRPRWVMIKNTGNGYDGGSLAFSHSWVIVDAARYGYNVVMPFLGANKADAEYTANIRLDLLSNGFKIRTNTGTDINGGETMIYAAFAESPFQYARAR
jgi:hypothetical protein